MQDDSQNKDENQNKQMPKASGIIRKVFKKKVVVNAVNDSTTQNNDKNSHIQLNNTNEKQHSENYIVFEEEACTDQKITTTVEQDENGNVIEKTEVSGSNMSRSHAQTVNSEELCNKQGICEKSEHSEAKSKENVTIDNCPQEKQVCSEDIKHSRSEKATKTENKEETIDECNKTVTPNKMKETENLEMLNIQESNDNAKDIKEESEKSESKSTEKEIAVQPILGDPLAQLEDSEVKVPESVVIAPVLGDFEQKVEAAEQMEKESNQEAPVLGNIEEKIEAAMNLSESKVIDAPILVNPLDKIAVAEEQKNEFVEEEKKDEKKKKVTKDRSMIFAQVPSRNSNDSALADHSNSAENNDQRLSDAISEPKIAEIHKVAENSPTVEDIIDNYESKLVNDNIQEQDMAKENVYTADIIAPINIQNNEANKELNDEVNDSHVQFNEQENKNHAVDDINRRPDNYVRAEGVFFKKREWLCCFWVERKFKLYENGDLICYKKDSESSIICQWNLKDATAYQKIEKEGNKKPFRLTFSAESKTVYFAYPDEASRDHWLDLFKDISRA